MKKEYVKPFAWGMAAGMVVLLIVIFSAGWVVTSGSAKAEAKTIAADAVMNRLAPIAVAQFMQDPNKEELLKEMKKLDSWERTTEVTMCKNRAGRQCPVRRNPMSKLPMRLPDGLTISKCKDPLVL